MADKRISQLVDRGTVVNNDVVPIVVNGAVTTNKATISSIQTFMQGNLDMGVTSVGITLGTSGTNINVTGSPVTSSGNITINIPTASATNRGLLNSADWNTFNSKLDSVGLIMPSAFTVTNSPLTSNGSISVAGAGTVGQYVRGNGTLADFPSISGGGSSVSYYLNGSVNQGTIGGIAYREINKTPILGAGTDFTIAADGYIASFITDAGDPALLEIPAGNWNFETYLSASSSGGSPTFYIELYKVNSGGTATLIASNSATPESISFGTNINPYFSALAVPTTSLTLTDRLAIRIYVVHSGRTITLHTENSHLCQIITTFTTGLTALNGLTAQVQNFATGNSGTDFAISSASTTHTFNLPTASATNRGALSSADWSTFNGKQAALNGTGFVKISGTSISYDNSTYLTTGTAASTYLPLAGGTLTGALSGTSANFTGSVGIGTITPEGSGLTVASGGILVSLDPGAARKVLELYATSTGAKVSSSYVGASSYGSLELLTSGLARLTIADTGGVTLTGALNGTTGTFSTASGNNQFNIVAPSGFSPYITLTQTGTVTYAIVSTPTTGDFTISEAGFDARFRIAKTTGAATFSSSVTSQVNNISADGAGVVLQGYVDNNLRIAVRGSAYNSGSRGGLLASTGDFSSSVTASGGASGVGLNIVNGTNARVIQMGYSTGSGTNYIQVYDGSNFQPLVLNNALTLAGSGAATFSNNLTLSNANSTTDLGGVLVVRGNGSAYNTHYLTTGAANVAAYNQYNASGTLINRINAGGDSYFTGGNVGIGTASPLQTSANRVVTTINGPAGGSAILNLGTGDTLRTYLYADSGGSTFETVGTNTISANGANVIAFTTNSTERMRINSVGFLKASNTGTYINAVTSYHELISNQTTFSLYIRGTNASPYGTVIDYTAVPNNAGNEYIYCTDNGFSTVRFSVRSNGGITNFQANNVNLSDERTKKDISPLESYWDKFKAIGIVKFKYKDQTHDDFNIGVIAQQVEQVAPEFVDVDGWDTKPKLDEEGNTIISEEEPLKSIYTADLHHATIKVLQEAMAKIEILEIEISSLKNQIK
jgi:hypothetical protein